MSLSGLPRNDSRGSQLGRLATSGSANLILPSSGGSNIHSPTGGGGNNSFRPLGGGGVGGIQEKKLSTASQNMEMAELFR